MYAPVWIFRRAGFHPSQKFFEDVMKIMFTVASGLIAIYFGLLTWKQLASLIFH
jgi:hypothetical protein